MITAHWAVFLILVVPALETHMLLGRRPGALSIAARPPRPDFSDQASKEGG